MSRIIAGIQPVREAIRALGDRVQKIVVARPHAGALSPTLLALSRFAEDNKIKIETATTAEIDRIAGGARHQGVVAIAPDLDVLTIDGLIALQPDLLVALDSIVDPQNFGAIVRSSVAFGAQAILWPEHASAPLTAATFRASAGAVEHAALCRVKSLPRALECLQGAGLLAVGLSGDSQTLLADVELSRPVVLVVGSEGAGLRRGVRTACDVLAKIPTRPRLATLNASVSVGVGLYEARRQRDHAACPASDAPT